MCHHIVAFNDGRNNIPLYDGRMLIFKLTSCLGKRFANKELVEGDKILLVIVHQFGLINFSFLLFMIHSV